MLSEKREREKRDEKYVEKAVFLGSKGFTSPKVVQLTDCLKEQVNLISSRKNVPCTTIVLLQSMFVQPLNYTLVDG